MTSTPTRWSSEELLADHPDLEPLVAAGQRCHGGFDADGEYLSPRTRFRTAADRGVAGLSTARSSAPSSRRRLDSWPASSPNVAQSSSLLEAGSPRPVISALTRIGTVEGFGGAMRMWIVEDLQSHFDEEIAGPTLEHLPACSRPRRATKPVGKTSSATSDMWFVARDIAFEDPVVEDLTDRCCSGSGSRRRRAPRRRLPEEIRRRQLEARGSSRARSALEMLIARMVNLCSSRSRRSTRSRGPRSCSSDADLVAGDGEAARLVSYIRQDESPHVEYLRDRADRDARPHVRGSLRRADRGRDGDRRTLGARIRGVDRSPAGPPACAWLAPSSSTRSPIAADRDEVLDALRSARHGERRGRGNVKFGIFYEHQLPRPWEDDSE